MRPRINNSPILLWSRSKHKSSNIINLPFSNYFQELIAVFLAFFGDLYFSKIKRIFNIKDYQIIIPGHGGILDRIDALLPVLPLTTLILILLS